MAIYQDQEQQVKTVNMGKVAVFFIVMLAVSRAFSDIAIHSQFLAWSTWSTPSSWIPALGFAVIFTVIYWKNQRS